MSQYLKGQQKREEKGQKLCAGLGRTFFSNYACEKMIGQESFWAYNSKHSLFIILCPFFLKNGALMANPVAAALIKEGYVQINLAQPFTYVSGLQGPIYCDNRQI